MQGDGVGLGRQRKWDQDQIPSLSEPVIVLLWYQLATRFKVAKLWGGEKRIERRWEKRKGMGKEGERETRQGKKCTLPIQLWRQVWKQASLVGLGVQTHLPVSGEPPGQHPVPFVSDFLPPAAWWDWMNEWISGISPHTHKSPPWPSSSLPALFNSTHSSPPLSQGRKVHTRAQAGSESHFELRTKHLPCPPHSIYPPAGASLL